MINNVQFLASYVHRSENFVLATSNDEENTYDKPFFKKKGLPKKEIFLLVQVFFLRKSALERKYILR